MAEVVCLSTQYDLKAEFGAAFESVAPHLSLRDPEELSDPATTRIALVHAPGDGALRNLPALELICTWGAGVDRMIGHPGLRPGVVLNRMTDPGQADMMAAFAAHYVTGWHRGLFAYPAKQAARRWELENWTPNAEFPVGILGYGYMGAAIGRALRALGYPVRAWAAQAREEDGVEVAAGSTGFESILSGSRAIINVLPLTDATRCILNAGAFARMRADAVLVQLGRGAHLVEQDLIEALDDGRPGLAVLDVFDVEPLPLEHPFWKHPRVRVTPHAGSSPSPQGVAAAVARAVAAHEAGERPEGAVDLARGY